jgi:AcrR family transcriptional regulator
VAIQPDTRTQLIEATIAAIAQGGESSVRVSSISAAVGVREPSVYHFFKNRKALVEAAQIERYRSSYMEMIIPFELAVEISDSLEEFARATRKILLMIFAPERHQMRAIRLNVLGAAQTSRTIMEEVNRTNSLVIAHLAEVLGAARARGWITNEFDDKAIGYWIMGQINGRIMAEINQEDVNLDEWNKVAIEGILAIFNPRPL